MAKRGVAKKAKRRVPKELTRKQRSRLERERRMQRLLIWGVVVVSVLVVGVLAYGLIVETIIKARQPVAIVSGAPITTDEFQGRVRFVRMQMQVELQQLLRQQQNLDPTDPSTEPYLEYVQGSIRDLQSELAPENALVIGEQALDQLVQESLVRQEAERRGIVVTPDGVQQAIEQYFGYDRNPATPTPQPTATPPLTPTQVLTPTPTAVPLPTPTPMTEEDFLRLYATYRNETLKPLGISEQQYRSWIEAMLLLDKLMEQMSAEVPAVAEQVKLRLLSGEGEEQANELAARWDAGEDFQALADELTESEEVNGYGRELNWLPRSVLEEGLGPELADLAFSLAVGERSQPTLGLDGVQYNIIEVVGHEERDLDPLVHRQFAEEAFQEWLNAQMQVAVERRAYRDRVPSEP